MPGFVQTEEVLRSVDALVNMLHPKFGALKICDPKGTNPDLIAAHGARKIDEAIAFVY
jgi:hypothetical protein